MKKMFKRVGSMVMAALVALVLCVPAMAAAPSASDTVKVSVSNVDAGATVTAYQIVKAKYGDNGFAGYEEVLTGTVSKNADGVFSPTDTEIIALSKRLGDLGAPVAMTYDTATEKFSADLAAGEWMVIAKAGTGVDKIYNPILVSAYYSADDNTMTAGDADASANWTLTTEGAYAKSSTIPNEKTIVGHSPDDPVASDKGDDVAIGDTIDFNIHSVIPSYSGSYESVTFTIADAMDDGLDLDKESIKVYVGGSTTALAAENYDLTTTDHGFTVALKQAYILSLADKTEANRAIDVKYTATLNENATTNFAANKNTSTVTYTNDPSGGTTSITDQTHQYTFEIDGYINGTDLTQIIKHKSHEIIKVDENGNVVGQTFVDDGDTYVQGETKVTNALPGAIFKLTMGSKVYYAITNANGYFVADDAENAAVEYTLADGSTITGADIKGFRGLDAGTGTITEVKAPAGYTLNTGSTSVAISASYNDDGTLNSYTINIGGNDSTYTATYENGTITEIDEGTENGDNVTTYIKNVKTPALPSTGGMGTTLFTTIGAAIVAVAGALLIFGRRRKTS